MAGYNIWVENSRYRTTVNRLASLDSEVDAANRRVERARRQMGDANALIDRQGNIDTAALRRALSREGRRLENSLEDVEETFRIAIGRQNLLFREEVDRIRQQAAMVDAHVAQVDRRVDEIAQHFNDEMQRIFDSIEDKRSRAQAYRYELAVMLEEIGGLNPEKLTPLDYDEVSAKLNYADVDISNKDYEAAIGVVQTAIPSAVTLQNRLEELNLEYSRIVEEISSLSVKMLERVNTIADEDNEDNHTPLRGRGAEEGLLFDGRYSFWTYGLMDTLFECFFDICEAVTEEYEVNMDIESLKLALADLKALEEKIDNCILLAHQEFYETHLQITLAQRIHATITAANTNSEWTLCESGFVDGDERKTYTFSYRNNLGRIATFTVIPAPEIVQQTKKGPVLGGTQFRLNVSSENYITGEETDNCMIERRAIISSLAQAGISNMDILNDRESYKTISDQDRFLKETATYGERIRNDRINLATQQILQN